MSSEKLYNHIEEKIAEAAAAVDYAYNEASWNKMEALLDKEKKKRRFIFWLSGIIVLGGLFTALVVNDMYKKPSVSAQNGKNSAQQTVNTSGVNMPGSQDLSSTPVTVTGNGDETSFSGETTTATGDNGTDGIKATSASGNKQNVIEEFTPLIELTPGQKKTDKKGITASEQYTEAGKNIYTDKNKFAVKIMSPQPESGGEEDAQTPVNTDLAAATAKNQTGLSETISKVKKTELTDTAKAKSNLTVDTDKKNPKKNKPFRGFYLTASVGAEVSSAKFLSYKNSSITPAYGAGLGYQLNKRISLQAGFYAGAKKYVAGPKDYSVKPGSYLSMVKIIEVDANCMVYEIPVSLQYNFLIRPKTTYYAAAGLSSYIMKKEKYNYTYEIYNTRHSYPYTYTKNSHLLASLQVSAGMEKKISSRLYIQAAPTVALPLQGAGEGKVKIFTTRVHAGLKYFPFKH